MELPNFRLSTRIAIAAIVIVVAGAVALMFIEEERLRDVYLNEQRTSLEQSLYAEKLRLKQAINILRQDVLLLSRTPPVSGIVRAGYDARYSYTRKVCEESLQQIFSAFSSARSDYYQIHYIGVAGGGSEIVRIDNRAGKIQISPPTRLHVKGDQDYFKATLGLRVGEVYLSEFNLNQESGVIKRPYQPTLRATTPVFTPSGQIFGMVVISMDVSHLLAPPPGDMPAGGQTYITNMNGGYLLHPDTTRSFEFELGSKNKISTDFPIFETMPNLWVSEHLPLQAVPTKMGAQYLAAERIHFDPRDPARFLLLVHTLPAAVATQQFLTISAKHIAIGFMAMLLVSGIALFVLRRIFAPLEQIITAADKIAAGNHEVSLPQKGSGEIGKLANALNTMLAKLLLREEDVCRVNAGLEDRVRERTIELERTQRETETLLRRNQALMLTSMDGILVLDMQGNLLEANDSFCRMLGYSQEEMSRLNVADWDAQWSAKELQERCKKLVGKSARFETVHRRKDGTLINVEISASGVVLEGQSFIFTTSRDITERKKIEEARLNESEARFRGTLEQAAVGIVHASLDGLYLQVNERFCTIVGYSRDELMHMGFRDITYPVDMDKDIAYTQQLLAGEISTFSLEKRYVRKDQSLTWVNLTVSLLRNIDGTPKYIIAVSEDISERKRVESALAVSEERARLAISASHLALWDFDLEKGSVYLSEGWSQLLGGEQQPTFTTMQELTRLVPEEEQYKVRAAILEAVKGHEFTSYTVTHRARKFDGGYIWLLSEGRVIERDQNGRALRMIGTNRDITEHKMAVDAVYKSEMKYRTLIESSHDAIMMATAEEGFLSGNPAAVALFGCRDEQEFITFTPAAVSPEFQPDGRRSDVGALEMIRLAMETGSHFFEWVHMRVGGGEFIAEVLLTCMDVEGKKIIQATVRDITERKRVEQQLRDLSTHLQTVREEEKASVAREIHDDLGSTLTALKMDVYWLADELAANTEARLLREHVESMSQLLDNAVAVTRHVITDLRPTILDDLGLQAAIEWQIGQFQNRTGIQCSVICTIDKCCDGKLNKMESINLFRIFQESLTNVARHSGASRVEVKLCCEDEKMILSISDNGCGLPEGHTIAKTSYGMLGMRERVVPLGGRIIFNNLSGGGFCVTVILPLLVGNQKEKKI